MNHAQLIENLTPCVLKAGEKIMEIYGNTDGTRFKKDGSPVTNADTAAEEIITSELKRIAPDILIISEENQSSHLKKPDAKFFLVDPLDGTKEFLKHGGSGSFTVNIGLIENQTPVMGIVYAPALQRLFCGYYDGGAWETIKGKNKMLSVDTMHKRKLIAVASTSHRDKETNEWLEQKNIETTISIGSSLKFCLVASGEADVYPRFSPTMEWDTAAGDAILRSAGGVVTTPNLSNFVYGKENYKNGPFIAWGRLRE